MSVEIKIGEFVSESGAILVTDPCYSLNTPSTYCMLCEPGRYETFVVKNSERRIEEISMYFFGMDRSVEWVATNAVIGVDSGQAGFFDLLGYPEGDVGEYNDSNSFYGKVCALTLSEKMAGTLPFGAVSSSGWGDGCYDLYVVKDASGIITAAKIVFIDDAVDDSDEEFYNEDELLYDEE